MIIQKGFIPNINIYYQCLRNQIRLYSITANNNKLKCIFPYNFTKNSQILFYEKMMIQSILQEAVIQQKSSKLELQLPYLNRIKNLCKLTDQILTFRTKNPIISFTTLIKSPLAFYLIVETQRLFIFFEYDKNNNYSDVLKQKLIVQKESVDIIKYRLINNLDISVINNNNANLQSNSKMYEEQNKNDLISVYSLFILDNKNILTIYSLDSNFHNVVDISKFENISDFQVMNGVLYQIIFAQQNVSYKNELIISCFDTQKNYWQMFSRVNLQWFGCSKFTKIIFSNADLISNNTSKILNNIFLVDKDIKNNKLFIIVINMNDNSNNDISKCFRKVYLDDPLHLTDINIFEKMLQFKTLSDGMYNIRKFNNIKYSIDMYLINQQQQVQKIQIPFYKSENQNKLAVLIENLERLYNANGILMPYFQDYYRNTFISHKSQIQQNNNYSCIALKDLIENCHQEFIECIFSEKQTNQFLRTQEMNINLDGFVRFNLYIEQILKQYRQQILEIFSQSQSFSSELKQKEKQIYLQLLGKTYKQITNIKNHVLNFRTFQNYMILKIKSYFSISLDNQIQESILQSFIQTYQKISCFVEITRFIIFYYDHLIHKYASNQSPIIIIIENILQIIFKNIYQWQNQFKQKYQSSNKFYNNQFELLHPIQMFQGINDWCQRNNIKTILGSNILPGKYEFIQILFTSTLFELKFLLHTFMITINLDDNVRQSVFQISNEELKLFKTLNFSFIQMQSKKKRTLQIQESFHTIFNSNLVKYHSKKPLIPQFMYIFMFKFAIYYDYSKYAIYILIQKINWRANRKLFILGHLYTVNIDLAYLTISSAWDALGIDKNRINTSQKMEYLKQLFQICLDNNGVSQLFRIAPDMLNEEKVLLRDVYESKNKFLNINKNDFLY